MSPVIREAQVHEVGTLVRLGAMMHTESNYAFLPYDEAKAAAVVHRWITEPDHLLAVAESGGVPVGGIALALQEYMFCRELVAVDRLVFVVPDHRGAGIARALIQRGRRWARWAGARELCLGVSTGVSPERVDTLYRSAGLNPTGVIYKEKL